jgi:hypothetical protein
MTTKSDWISASSPWAACSACNWPKGWTKTGRNLWKPPGQGSSSARGRSRLVAAGEARQRLHAGAIDPEGMVYVAGQAPATPSDVRPATIEHPFFGSEAGLAFQASPRGDSQVLWDTGLLPDVPTWYMTGVVHGDLANHEDAFKALRELVEAGDTNALARQAPVTRGAAAAFAMPDFQPAYLPDQRSLLTSALGMGPAPQRSTQRQKIQVSITHGDLATTSRTVAVGHYCGDTIVGPEAYLDRVLGHRLRRCQALGLYPGAVGSQEVFYNPRPQAKPRGALVVGLGKVGELSTGTLADSFSRALLAYCRDEIERRPAPVDGSCPALELRVTSLLIGTGAGGIGVEESLAALLRGVVRANDLLSETLQQDTVRISSLRVIELWEQTAIHASHVLADLEQDPELMDRLDCDRTLSECAGGKRGPRALDDPEWWHRLQIQAPAGKPMRFTSLTRRARAEQDLLSTQEVMVDRFIADAIGSVHHGSETSRTLYEMLLPNRLKDGVEMRGNLVLTRTWSAA